MAKKYELAQCPFCGGEAEMNSNDAIFGCTFITCTECTANGPSFSTGRGAKQAAALAWNTRAKPAPAGAGPAYVTPINKLHH